MIVSYNDNSVLTQTIGEALAQLFPGFDGDVGDRIGLAVEPGPDDGDPGTQPEIPVDAAELLLAADALFSEADDALALGDLGLYQQKVDEARQRVAEALEILGGDTAPADSTSDDSQEPEPDDEAGS